MGSKSVSARLRSIVRLLAWWRLQVPVVAGLRTTPRRGRWHLLSTDAPGHLGTTWRIWRLLSPRRIDIDLRDGVIHVDRATINGDRGVFAEVFVANCYRTDLEGAVVVDIGAHKGYFGAYALLNGAHAVFSYEPERRNFADLERAASSFRNRGHVWHAIHAAVTSTEGQRKLYVHEESWSHSLHVASAAGDRDVQEVRVVALSDVLHEADQLAGKLIVKIDAEGSECEMILDTPQHDWRRVDEVFVELHDFSGCTAGDVIAHVGLTVVRQDDIVHLRR